MVGDSEGAGEDIGVDRGWRLGRQDRHLLPAAERTKRHTDMHYAHFRRSGGPPHIVSAHIGRNEASAIQAGLDPWNPTDAARKRTTLNYSQQYANITSSKARTNK